MENITEYSGKSEECITITTKQKKRAYGANKCHRDDIQSPVMLSSKVSRPNLDLYKKIRLEKLIKKVKTILLWLLKAAAALLIMYWIAPLTYGDYGNGYELKYRNYCTGENQENNKYEACQIVQSKAKFSTTKNLHTPKKEL